MRYRSIAVLVLSGAVTGCADPASTVASAGPTFVYQGQTPAQPPVSATDLVQSGNIVALRSSAARSWWYVRTGVSFNPDAPNAKGPNVIFTSSTGPDRFLIEKVAETSSPGPLIESGDLVRLHDVEHDGWLEANIDNPLFVVSDSRLHEEPNARFLIEKTSDAKDRRIKVGDRFLLRGIHGAPWLVAPVDGVVTITVDRAMATQFEFAAPPQP